MNTQPRGSVNVLLLGLCVLGCSIGLIVLEWSLSHRARLAPSNRAGVPLALVLSGPQRLASGAGQLARQSNESWSNILELPKASLDFVGAWGGYTHSEIHSAVPGRLIGRNPDRVSVVFGRSGDTVFIGSELYSPPNQQLRGEPTARIPNSGELLIEYASNDAELHYVYTHRFRLLASGRIVYREKVYLYERRTNHFVGLVEQRATLKRLLTANERILFARPSFDQVPRREVLSHRRFPVRGSNSQDRTH